MAAKKAVETTNMEANTMKENKVAEAFKNFLRKVKKGSIKVGKNFGKFCSKMIKLIAAGAKKAKNVIVAGVKGLLNVGIEVSKRVWIKIKKIFGAIKTFFKSVKMGFKVVGFVGGIISKFMAPAAAAEAIENTPKSGVDVEVSAEVTTPVRVKGGKKDKNKETKIEKVEGEIVEKEEQPKKEGKKTKTPIKMDEKVKTDFSAKPSNTIYDPGYVNEPIPGQA